MEGVTATRRQTLMVMDAMRIQETIGKGQREIQNALLADEFISDAVDRGVNLSESMIREINGLLLNDIDVNAGQFRTINVELPGAPFLPPDPTEVPALVGELSETFSLSESLHTIVQAAWAHAQFTLIHPFADGNGRGGRLLQDFVLLRRGLLPVGIPPSQRDDYYAALESADKGEWDALVEMLAILELSTVTKTKAIAKEPERRASWISKLSKAASATRQNTRHKQYLVWRQRMELISSAFGLAASELDDASDVVGTHFRDFGVIDYADWNTICKRGYLDQSWLFSILFFAEGAPFYKSIAYLRRHTPRPATDSFAPAKDIVSLYFTGSGPNDRPHFQHYSDPHIQLRELFYYDEELYRYQDTPDDDWAYDLSAEIGTVVEDFFTDVFYRKAGIAF
jgi:fido (protein-threonine AMPylation protein)